jgi:2-polyprenyl-3-methyl-5-hydroxy-6-metoxy-1,4-benzoquinol methylase
MVGIKDAAQSINEMYEAVIVGDLSKNWRAAEAADLRGHREFIKKNYIHPVTYWETEGGKKDLEGLTLGRVNRDRRTYIPWINSFLPLRGSSILEIGAGTGSSTVALAEQGATVIGVDILEQAIRVAKDKCRIFGVSAEFLVTNAVDYMTKSDEGFDAVIFFAVLEHMLPDERLKALARAWHIIRPQGYLIIIEAPNRLWYFDGHTAMLPFFNWLPEKLALQYMQFSPRVELVELLTPPSEANLLELQRWGLGVSFHEVDLSLGKDIRNLEHHSLGEFLRRRSPIRYLGWHITGDAKYVRFLKRAAPDVPGGWFEPYLNLAVQHP